MTNEIFGNAQTITGIETYYILRHNKTNKLIHLLGELHTSNGVKNHPNAIDLLPSNGTVLCELEHREMFTINDRDLKPNRPIISLVKKYFRETVNCPEVLPIDIRREEPYAILEILYQYNSFLFLNNQYFHNKKSLLLFHKKAKIFERDILQHFQTRIKMEKFLLSLIHPNNDIPKWYSKWCQAFERTTTALPDSTIKNKIKTLSSDLQEFIISFIHGEIETRLMNQDKYSKAMVSIENLRNTHSNTFVLEKFQSLKTFFTVLLGLLLDVSILYNIFNLLDSTDPVIVLAGDAHIFTIVNSLIKDETYVIEEVYTKNVLGYIRLNEKKESRNTPVNPLLSQSKLLHAFHNR